MAEDLRELTAQIVASYAGNNHVAAGDLADLIKTVHQSLTGADQPAASEPAAAAARPTPAQIRRSVSENAIISFENGKPYRSMKRHLTTLGLTPQEYRVKWGLAKDYPIVAPSYSAARSEMAKRLGLGKDSRGRPRPPTKPRGRKAAGPDQV